MAGELHVIAVVKARAGQADALRIALLGLVQATRREPGCLRYVLHENPKQAGHFYFYESYRDQAALDAHLGSRHLAAAFTQVGDLLAEPPEITPVKAIAG